MDEKGQLSHRWCRQHIQLQDLAKGIPNVSHQSIESNSPSCAASLPVSDWIILLRRHYSITHSVKAWSHRLYEWMFNLNLNFTLQLLLEKCDAWCAKLWLIKMGCHSSWSSASQPTLIRLLPACMNFSKKHIATLHNVISVLLYQEKMHAVLKVSPTFLVLPTLTVIRYASLLRRLWYATIKNMTI